MASQTEAGRNFKFSTEQLIEAYARMPLIRAGVRHAVHGGDVEAHTA